MPRRGEGRWRALLEDPDVKRWYDNLARGSRATADNYYRVLGRFLASNDLTTEGLLRLKGTAIALIAFSGLRPEALGTYLGDDGLRLRDFVEAQVTQNQLICKPVETKIEVPERLSKTGRAYFTFLGPEGCEYLNAYLRERAEAGETISTVSPLITPRKVEKPFMRTVNVGDLLRKPMRAAGLKEPPYIWRSYFASRAMLAESRGFSRDYRLFVMGHKGDIKQVYSLHKKIPPDAVEAIRRGYRAALGFLETTKSADREGELKAMFRKQILVVAGLTDAEIDKMDIEGLSDA